MTDSPTQSYLSEVRARPTSSLDIARLLAMVDCLREGLEYVAEDRLHSEHYGSEVKEKVYRRMSAKEALKRCDAIASGSGEGET